MISNVLVAYDGSEESLYALNRARQMATRVTVFTPPALDLTLAGWAEDPLIEINKVTNTDSKLVIGKAAEFIAPFAVITDYTITMLERFRSNLTHSLPKDGDRTNREIACLLMTNHHPGKRSEEYRNILVGADGSMGSGMAVLAAASVAQVSGADLEIICVERRTNQKSRKAFARMAKDPEFDPEIYRMPSSYSAEKLAYARRFINSTDVTAKFRYHEGDPAKVLLEELRWENCDLLVTGATGATSHTNGKIGSVTMQMFQHCSIDHLVVFDAVSLGLRPSSETKESAFEEASRIMRL